MRLPRCLATFHLLILAAVGAITLIGAAAGYPKPSAVPIRWELKFEPGDLRLYVDDLDGRVYWYFTYKVINNTGQDQTWAPEFTLYTDDGRIAVSGRDVPAWVTQDLLQLLGNEYLVQQNEAIGEILQGPNHAIEGLVVWPALDMEVTEISLFIAGISGDTATITAPGGEKIVLRKTKQRDYLVPGNILARVREPAGLVEERWIFR